MKKLMLVSSVFALSAFAGEYKGTISDAKCGAAHADASEKSIKCVQGCVKKGGEAVLVSEGKVLKIDAASKDKIAPHLGHKVTITGNLTGDTLTVDSVTMD